MSTRPSCRSSPGWRSSPLRSATCGSNRAGRSGAPRPEPTTRRGNSRRRCPAPSTSPSASRTCASACPTRSSRTAPATTPSWVHRFWRFHDFPSQLAPTSGAMGYGVPAAVAAKAVAPERTVVCFSGDGDFLMSGPGARDRGAVRACRSSILVVDNGMYGTIRMHQELHFPGARRRDRPRQPRLRGVRARIRRARRDGRARRDEFPAALERALAAGVPAVHHVAHRPGRDHAAHDAERDPGGRVSGGGDPRAGLAEPISHYTDAVRAGDLLFVSGCVPVDGEGKLVARRRRRAGAAGVREHRAGARCGRRGLRRRRQGDGLPHRRRRPGRR